jgi:hypothetical protein
MLAHKSPRRLAFARNGVANAPATRNPATNPSAKSTKGDAFLSEIDFLNMFL